MSGKNARNYTHLYDKSMYTSMWTAYPVYQFDGDSQKRPKWRKNDMIDAQYQIDIDNNSYPSGYDRGHLIPNGSRNKNKDMQEQTFYFTNSVPQKDANFNQSIWNDLENGIRGLVTTQKDTVYVVTGVAFRKIGETKDITTFKCGGKQCPVPNYFYKVVLKVKRGSAGEITSASTVGIWMEHRDYEKNEAYTDFTVSVDQIEERTGFDFFANLPESLQTTAETNTSWSTFATF